MKYAELVERVKELGPGSGYTLSWYDGVYSEADFTVVPLPDGRFTVYRPSGRGENSPHYDADGSERIFDNEDAVCDFVWAKLTTPKVTGAPSAPVVTPTPERIAEQRRKAFESLGRTDPRQHG